MSQEQLVNTLIGLGLSRLNSQVYLYLAKKGPQKGCEIVKGLNAQKYQIYRALKDLEKTGIVNVTLEHPAKFSAVPFETVVDMFVNSKMQEVRQIQENKDEILAKWQSIAVAEYADQTAKFNVIQGRNNIYSKIQQMIQSTRKQFVSTTTPVELTRAEEFGLFEAAKKKTNKEKVQFRFLTPLQKQDLSMMKKVLTEMAKSETTFEGRIPDLELNSFPQMVIRDQEEALFFITPGKQQPSERREESCLWTNSSSLVGAFQGIFDDLWQNSAPVDSKIAEIGTDKIQHKPSNVINAKTASQKYISWISEGLPKQFKSGILAEPVLVGRENELKELQQILESVLQSEGITVLVSGEAGTGKTRLLNEFINHAKNRNDVTILRGWCQSNAANPYFPFIEAFNSYFKEIQDQIENEEEEAKAWLTGEKSTALTPQALKDQTFAAITKSLTTISTKKPTVLCIEDMHWADSASIALLHYIARAIASERLLVLVTFRSDELFADAEGHEHPLAENLRFMRRENLYKEIKLTNLAQSDVLKIAENMLGGLVSKRFSEKLAEESKGNALFVVESLRMLHERGDLFQKNNEWLSSRENFEIPFKVQDIILQRINRLNHEQRRLLDAASVIGEKFDAELLAEVLSKEPLEVLEILNIVGRSTALVCADSNLYRFDHARSSEALYKEIPLPLRRGYHSKVANILESKSKEESSLLGDLSYHFAQAGDTDRAVKYALKAGRVALSRFSNVEAIKHFTYVLESVENRPTRLEEIAFALEGLGDALFANSKFAEASKTYERLSNSTTGVLKLRALRKAEDAAFFQHDFENLRRLVGKGEQCCSEDRLEAGRVQLNRGRSFEDISLRRLIEEQDKALRIFEEEYALRDTAWALLGTGSCLAYVDKMENGLSRMLRSLALFEELGDLSGKLAIHHRLAAAYFPMCGFIEEALDMIEKAENIAEKIGNFQRLAWARSIHAWLLESLGDVDGALSKSLEGLKSVDKTDDIDIEGVVCADLVRLFAKKGDLSKADVYFERLTRRRPNRILAYGLINIDLVKAILFAAKGQWKESEEFFEKSLISSNIEIDGYKAWVRLSYAWILEKHGKTQEAQQLREESLKIYLENEAAFAHPNIKASLMVPKKVVIGKAFELRLDMVNVSKSQASLIRVNGLIPFAAFKITPLTSWLKLKKGNLSMKRREISAFKTETVKLLLKGKKMGSFVLKPELTYLDDKGKIVFSNPEPFEISVVQDEHSKKKYLS